MMHYLGYAALALGLGLSVQAQASEALAKEKNCMTCHSLDRKIVGPSYRDILTKKPTEASMAQKIKQGSKGEWGAVPMPPNNVTEAEASTLAKWILTLK